MKKLVSIIVPIYKIPEEYLRECIESLCRQTLKEIEIILVDDESPDGCGEICDEYLRNDPRIVVIHQKNKGLSGARNSGFKVATGEWITFIDGDDWIEESMCENLYNYAMENNVDLICCGIIREYTNCSHKYNYSTQYKNKKIYSDEGCKYLQMKLLDYNGNIATAYAKLINRQFLISNKLFHNEELKQGAEGLEFNIRVFDKAKRIMFVEEYYYHYRYNDNSISTSHNEENHYLVLKCFEKIKQTIIHSNNEQLMKMFYNRLIYVIITVAISGYFNPTNNEPYRMKVKKYETYLKEDLVQEALKNAMLKEINTQRRIILFLIKTRQFRLLSLFAYLRKVQKQMK